MQPLNRLAILAPVAVGLFLVMLLVCPGAPRKVKPLPWHIAPSTIITAVGAKTMISAYRFEPGEPQDKGFQWSLEGGPAGASITQQGILTAPSTAGEFQVVAERKDLGVTLKVPVRVYEPPDGHAEDLPPMSFARLAPEMALLQDGTALVMGEDPSAPGWWGGFGSNPGGLYPGERFDPATKTFTAIGPLAMPRFGCSILPLKDGGALVLGGRGSGGDPAHLVERYDPATRTFSSAGSLIGSYEHPAVIEMEDGSIFVSGGGPAYDLHGSPLPATPPQAELLQRRPGTHDFEPRMLPPPTGAFREAFELPSGRIFLTGLKATGLFNPQTEAFSKLPLGGARRTFSLGGSRYLLVLNDPTRPMVALVTTVDAEVAKILKSSSVLVPKYSSVIGTVRGRLLWFGGLNILEEQGSVICFDPSLALRVELPSLRYRRYGPGVLQLKDGTVLVAGGAKDDAIRQPSAELYMLSH